MRRAAAAPYLLQESEARRGAWLSVRLGKSHGNLRRLEFLRTTARSQASRAEPSYQDLQSPVVAQQRRVARSERGHHPERCGRQDGSKSLSRHLSQRPRVNAPTC
eukprot:Amastigsp_a176958_48.p7 type:complete len:105 gc:universal Amastigsp_a176958_48:2573-2259(-)